MTMYLCITDKGGKNPTCPDINYQLPQQHLIKSHKQLTNEDIRNLIKKMLKTRIGIEFIGSWNEEDILDLEEGSV